MVHPIAVTIYATDTDVLLPQRLLHRARTARPTTSVLLCGWDDAACSGHGAWLIKNSWGTSWGVRAASAGSSYGTCSIGGGGATASTTSPSPSRGSPTPSHAILDGGNGALDPNETAQISVTVTNFGTGTATDVSGVAAPR